MRLFVSRPFEPITASPVLELNARRMSNIKQEDYQYIHKSKIPTLVFQDSLPTLRIPKLEKTTTRFLDALKPILDSNDYANSEKAVKDFLIPNGWGERLQNQLKDIEKESPYGNYLYKIWLDKLLSNRLPLPLYCTPVILLKKDPAPGLNKQDVRSTNLLISSLRFMKTFRDGLLKPELSHPNAKITDKLMFRAFISCLPPSMAANGATFFNALPLDMSKYGYLFNSSRIPGITKDSLYQDEKEKHVIVIRRGHFFAFNVLDDDGKILNPFEILACIKYIISMTDCSLGDTCHPVAALTTLDRKKWANLRKNLREFSEANAKSLHKIDSALLVIALDTESFPEIDSLLHSMLCGNGTNRWYDKSFNLIVDKHGEAAVCYEQSWDDGVAVMRYINEIYEDSIKIPQVNEYSSIQGDPVSKVKKLEFNFDEKLKDQIQRALSDYLTAIIDVEVNTFTTNELGTNFCRVKSLNPDAVIQLGLQLAHHKLTGDFVGMHELCSTAAFKFGRTDVIRPSTMEVKDLCEYFNSNCHHSSQIIRRKVAKCSFIHEKLRKKAMMGQGFDRHLFALHTVAEKYCSSQLPQIFQDMGYRTINCNSLSSSQLTSPYIQGGLFGSCHKDGYSTWYMLQRDYFKIFVTNFKGYFNGKEFVNCVHSVFEQLLRKYHKHN